MEKTQQTITVLGKTFNSEEERRTYFREELRKKLPELKQMEGFPIGEDEDILNLSDPPYYTACPNPWLNDFITEWENEKALLLKKGIRKAKFSVNEPFAFDVSEGKSNDVYKAHSYHTKVPHPIIMQYILAYTQPGDIVYDGFCGTGMTGVAANRLDKRDTSEYITLNNKLQNKIDNIVFGQRHSIISDLSPFATFISNGLTRLNGIATTRSFKEKLRSAYKEYQWMYETIHESTGQRGKVNYFVWSDIYSCNNCSDEFSIWEAALDKSAGLIRKEFHCPKCQSLTDKIKSSKVLETVVDPVTKKTRQSVKRKLVLINYSIGKKRYEKVPDLTDLEVLERVSLLDINVLSEEMFWGDTYRSGYHAGLIYAHDFYTTRNLYFLARLWEKLEFDEKILLTSGIGRNLSHLNRYIFYKGKGGIGRPLSGTLYVSSEIVEQSPMHLLDGKVFRNGNDGYDNSTVVSTNSATLTSLKSNSIDYIFTDPPFGSNLMYSELNFLTEWWLKVRTNIKNEAIENVTQNKSLIEYQGLMSSSFKEYFRVLKPGKWMTVEFSNTSAAVWNSIQTSITQSGFIVANVSALDKKHGGIKAMTYATAVKQDLVISCYKPSSEFDKRFNQNVTSGFAVWDFIDEHLKHLPIHLVKENATTAILERSPKILFDRLIAFYVQKGLSVPIDAGAFQKGLRERFIERDGMFFTNEQVQEYDKKKEENPEFIQLSILVSSEQDGVLWLRNLLNEKPLKHQDIHPLWMQALAGLRKGDVIPELLEMLEDNFLKDEQGKWYVPDPENEADLEKLRTKRLLKQFEAYKIEAFKPKGKIKEVRVEALRAGFKEAYQEKDFKTIVQIGDRIPNNLLMEDEVLLQFYDIAVSRV